MMEQNNLNTHHSSFDSSHAIVQLPYEDREVVMLVMLISTRTRLPRLCDFILCVRERSAV
jgi:hypothetical protein